MTRADILHFVASVTYMGSSNVLPKAIIFQVIDQAIHPSLIKLNKTTIVYLWHWFHTSYKEGDAENTEILYDDDKEEIVDEQTP
jgi:hypothetical protein